jgi:hypothetical protein
MGEGYTVTLLDQYGRHVMMFTPPQNKRNGSRYRIAVTYTGPEEQANEIERAWTGQKRREEHEQSLADAASEDLQSRVDSIMSAFTRTRYSAFASLSDKLNILIRCAMDMYGTSNVPAGRRDEYAKMSSAVLHGLLRFRLPTLSFPEFTSVQSTSSLADILYSTMVLPLGAVDEYWLNMDPNRMTEQDRTILRELHKDLNQPQTDGMVFSAESMLDALKEMAAACPELVSEPPCTIPDPELLDENVPSHAIVYRCHYFTRRTIRNRFSSDTQLRFRRFPLKAMPFYPITVE